MSTPLTSFQIQQKDFLIRQYPMLPEDVMETIVRLTEDQKNDICKKIKSGELKHEDARSSPEEYTIQSVKVSD